MSAWTDVIASPGTRTTGSKEQGYMITGPNWKEKLREGVGRLQIVLGVGFVAEVFFAVRTAIGFSRHVPAGFDAINKGGNAQAIARVLFRKYFFPFEVTSILLIIAAIAAMVLAQRKAPAITQAEMDARVAEPEPVPTGSEVTA
jgi:hypothetical protein